MLDEFLSQDTKEPWKQHVEKDMIKLHNEHNDDHDVLVSFLFCDCYHESHSNIIALSGENVCYSHGGGCVRGKVRS